MTTRTFLHVGCGPATKMATTRGFAVPEWNEVRLDINPDVHPDIIGTMTDMSAVAAESMDALFSSHNIEHLYAHEVPEALAEFRRVLKRDGFVVVTCPDLQRVCKLVAEDKLNDTAYECAAGAIAPIDILYGHRPSLAAGNLHMAHRYGFTPKTLTQALVDAGFAIVMTTGSGLNLWAIATVDKKSPAELESLAKQHFPG